MTTAGCITCVGLGIEVVGALLVAWDYWHRVHPGTIGTDHRLHRAIGLIGTALATGGASDRDEAVKAAKELIADAGMADCASRSDSSRLAARIVTAGRVGLVLVVVGFVLQFAGTIVGSST